jgi:hypothetical protein
MQGVPEQSSALRRFTWTPDVHPPAVRCDREPVGRRVPAGVPLLPVGAGVAAFGTVLVELAG